jgi:hypothetical protein
MKTNIRLQTELRQLRAAHNTLLLQGSNNEKYLKERLDDVLRVNDELNERNDQLYNDMLSKQTANEKHLQDQLSAAEIELDELRTANNNLLLQKTDTEVYWENRARASEIELEESDIAVRNVRSELGAAEIELEELRAAYNTLLLERDKQQLMQLNRLIAQGVVRGHDEE